MRIPVSDPTPGALSDPVWAERPADDEYSPAYAGYVSLPADGDILQALSAQMATTQAMLLAVASDRESWRPSPQRWTLREVVGHLIDFERVMAFRALWFARGEPGPLGSMDQDRWVPGSGADHRPLTALTAEWSAVRRSTVCMASGFEAECLLRHGVAADARVSVRALIWVIAGHELHHRRLLERDWLQP